MTETITSKNDVENYVYSIKSSLNDTKLTDKITDKSSIETMNTVLSTFETWNVEKHEKEEYDSKKIEIETIWKPIMTLLYSTSETTTDIPQSSDVD